MKGKKTETDKGFKNILGSEILAYEHGRNQEQKKLTCTAQHVRDSRLTVI